MAIKSGMSPVHPGAVLREELDALGLSANALAKAIGVPANRVTAILNAERGITADTALRLGRYFDSSAQFWLNLQQAWQLRRAEAKSGPRILERVVPRQAEALSTAARQAKAVSGQASSMLQAVEQNLSLCEQLCAAERAIGQFSSNQAMLRTLVGPLYELRRVGALRSGLGEELQRTTRWLAEHERRFRLADPSHVSRLLDQLRTTQRAHAVAPPAPLGILSRHLAAMKNPWLDVENELGSVKGILGLQKIGEVIGRQATFSEAVAVPVRERLGDWRESVTWPDEIWRDLAARADFYAERGFDADLTNFPPAAFREAAEVVRVWSEPPPLVEFYGSPVRSSSANEEAAFVRTNEAHDRLQRLESQLRRFIDAKMTREFGPGWPRHRLPNGMYDEWRKKEDADRAGRSERVLVAYADFTDYDRIITRKDNWQLFKGCFERRENVRESFHRLRPIRVDVMHARPISQDDELLLLVEARRIMGAIES